MIEDGEIRTLLGDGCRVLDLGVSGDGLDRLETYYHELRRWSRKMNLIGKSQSAKDIIANHFLDSLILLPHFRKRPCSLVDIGSGAGFPGLICKAAEPEIELKLVEPRLKRVSFLRHIIRCLHLENVEVIAERVENVAPESLDGSHIVSRAVADIAEFLEMIEDTVTEKSRVFCMKGPKWQEELEQAQPVIDRLELQLDQCEEFFLPLSGRQRVILTFCKR